MISILHILCNQFCFGVIAFMITLVHVLVPSYGRQTVKGVSGGAYGRHSFWMRVVKKIKVAAFSHDENMPMQYTEIFKYEK